MGINASLNGGKCRRIRGENAPDRRKNAKKAKRKQSGAASSTKKDGISAGPDSAAKYSDTAREDVTSPSICDKINTDAGFCVNGCDTGSANGGYHSSESTGWYHDPAKDKKPVGR